MTYEQLHTAAVIEGAKLNDKIQAEFRKERDSMNKKGGAE